MKYNLAIACCLFLTACGTDVVVPPKPQGYYKVGKPYQVEGRTYYPAEVADYAEEGMASWYGPGFYGKRTANGDIMGREDVTAAHRTLPMPSVVKITSLENNKSIMAKVNDRGPFSKDRIIDVSKSAAQQLGFHGNGTARVRVEFMPNESRIMAEAAKRGNNISLADALAATPSVTPPQMVIAETTIEQAAPIPSGKIDTESLDDNAITVITPPAPTASIQAANYAVPPAPPAIVQTSGPATVITETTVKRGLYVQAGAFAKQQNAEAAAHKLRGLGRVEIVPVERNDVTLYRVRLPAASEADAANLQQQIQQTGLVGAKVISE